MSPKDKEGTGGEGRTPVKNPRMSGSSTGGDAGTSRSAQGGAERVVRSRGGFRSQELNTIPAGIVSKRAADAKGKQIVVLANFVKVSPMPESEIYQYRVDFEPSVESTRLRSRLFRGVSQNLFNSRCIFDGESDARSSVRLPEATTSIDVENAQEPGNMVRVIIKNVGVVTNSFETIRLYNMHMKEFMRHLGFFRATNSGAYVNPEFYDEIDGGEIMAMRGFRTAANVHEEGKILVNFESVHKLVQKNNVMSYMRHLRGLDNFKTIIKTELIGKLVVTRYNKIVYRVENVDFNSNPMSEFEMRDGTRTTFQRYFQEKHNQRISDLGQPLLVAVQNSRRRRDEEGDPQEVKLVPEFCNIAGLTDEQRNNSRLKRSLIQSSQIGPAERVRHLRKFLSKLHQTPEISAILNQWRYKYDSDLTEIKCRTMDTESIGLGRKSGAPVEHWPKVDPVTASFDKIVTTDTLAVAPAFEKLKILVGRSDIPNSERVNAALRTGFTKINLVPRNVEVILMEEGDNMNSFVSRLRNLPNDTSAALVLMPSQNKEKYDAIKKLATTERGLITQVVTTRLMMDDKKRSGAAVKIAIQLAAKLGGEPWLVNIPISGTMVCGYDTYHDTAKRGRSYGAFVASMNKKFSKWWSKADSHERLDELSTNMAENLRQALKRYNELNQGSYPDRLIIYRDGVSDGQLEHVYSVELKQVRNVVKSIDENIRLGFVVVNKRIGARFYFKNGSDFLNCPPGTVIDSVVTRQERYDFYLISQSTRSGTVSPTYYNIIYDETGLDAAKHQAMAYKLCFAYYNWSGTVKVPAPCQYAHKLALLCGEHLHSVPSSSLDNRLHFL